VAHIRRVKTRRQPWVVRFRTPDGLERSRSFSRKTAAEAFRASVETARNRGELVDPSQGRIRLDAWSEEWLTIVSVDLKPKTIASYRSLLDSRILPSFGAWTLAHLRPGDVDRWIVGMRSDGLSPSRIRQAHVVLSAMLELAVRHDRIPRNVARGADLPAIRRKEAAYFDPSTVDRIVDVVPEAYGSFIAVQGVLGLRVGEAAALRRRSVDLLHKRLRVAESLSEIGGALSFGPTKSHAVRAIPLPPTILIALERHLAEDVGPGPEALLFTSAWGYPIRYSRFRPTVWVPALERLNLPRVGIHALRHSAAAGMIRAGWSAKAVQQVLGHASAAFTLTVYAHLFDDDLDALADALDRFSRGTGAVQTVALLPEKGP
jgi:integrase